MKHIYFLLFFVFISKALFAQVFIAENTKVKLHNSTNISVAGNFNHNGSIEGSGFMQLISNQSQTLKGDGLIENFSINKTGGQAEVVAGNQDVFRTFEIHGGTFVPNAKFTLKSNDTLSAQIGTNTGGSITGDFIIERFIPKSNRAYRYISSPVSTSGSIRENLQEGQNNTGINFPNDNLNSKPEFGTHITGSKTGNNGFDATQSGNQSFFNWDAGNQSWTGINNTDTKTLDKAESFALLIRGSRATDLNSNSAVGPETTLRLTGNPTILNYTESIDLISDQSFVLLGNPYQATIDANLVMQSNPSLNSNFIYVFDPTLNTKGGYATVELTEGGINQQGSEANQYIQPWQSVFVKAENTGATTLNLSFSENDKNISQLKAETMSTNPRINLKLQSEGEIIDGVSLKLKKGANSEIDNRDAIKFWNTDESLSIYSHGKYISIEERDFPQDADTIMIRVDQKRQQNYEFVINASGLNQTEAVFKDFYLDEAYSLPSNDDIVINYKVEAGENDLRFGIIVGSKTLSTEDIKPNDFKIYPNPAEELMTIEAISENDKPLKFEIYSLLGQKVADGEIAKQLETIDVSKLSAGVYLVMISDGSSLKETLKLIKN